MRRAHSSLLVFGLLLFAGAAHAQDAKSYGGGGCFSADDGLAVFNRGPNGTVENTDNAVQDVFCPIVREYLNLPLALQVWVYDQHAADNVQCRLTSRFPDGTIFAFAVQSSAGNMAAAQVLNFAALAAPAGGHYTLRCTIPGVSAAGNLSSIASYIAVE